MSFDIHTILSTTAVEKFLMYHSMSEQYNLYSWICYIQEKYNLSAEICLKLKEEEKKLVEITKDNEVKEINERSFGCYRLWKDWVKHFVSEMDEEEIERTIKTRINVCPRCGVGEIEEKVGKYGKFNACSNFPNCRYTVNILSDEYYDFNRKNEELFLIRQEISKRKIIKWI